MDFVKAVAIIGLLLLGAASLLFVSLMSTHERIKWLFFLLFPIVFFSGLWTLITLLPFLGSFLNPGEGMEGLISLAIWIVAFYSLPVYLLFAFSLYHLIKYCEVSKSGFWITLGLCFVGWFIMNRMLTRPITVLVVDESSKPVEDALVHWDSSSDIDFLLGVQKKGRNRTLKRGETQFRLFKFQGVSCRATKDDYYSYENSRAIMEKTFQRSHSLKNPFIKLILRKKGETEPLIHVKNRIYFPKDGSPIEINFSKQSFTKGVPQGQGHVIVECWVNDAGIDRTGYNPYDWKFRLTVPDGGLVERVGKFNFTAPENGYQPFYEVNMPRSLGKEWDSSVEKEFFVKLKDGNYARIHLEVIADSETVVIESFFNPSGSRNLEFDETKQINN